MTIKIISQNDIPKVKLLLEKLYIELGEEKESITFLSDDLIRKLIKNEKTIILKASDEKQDIIGILTLTESQAIYSGGSFGTIDEMYVTPQYRNQKIGEKLINEVLTIAKNKNWKRVDVTAPTDDNPATINFYKRNGFIYTGPKLKYSIS